MKFIATILASLTIVSTMFSFGDAFMLDLDEIHAEEIVVIMDESGSHNENVQNHDEHNEDEDHGDDSDCDGECHVCICTCSTTIMMPFNDKVDIDGIEYHTYSQTLDFYESSYTNQYLTTIFQPPQA